MSYHFDVRTELTIHTLSFIQSFPALDAGTHAQCLVRTHFITAAKWHARRIRSLSVNWYRSEFFRGSRARQVSPSRLLAEAPMSRTSSRGSEDRPLKARCLLSSLRSSSYLPCFHGFLRISERPRPVHKYKDHAAGPSRRHVTPIRS
jgi:hypothetical protein